MRWIMIMMISGLAGCMTTYEMAQEAPIQSFCPDFGRITKVEFPVDADPGRMYVRTLSGTAIAVERRWAMKVNSIATYEEFEHYLDLYTEVCGGLPPWISEVPFFAGRFKDISALSKLIHELRDRLRDAMDAFPDFEGMRPDIRRLKEIKEQIGKTEKELSGLNVESFRIAGEIVSLKPNYVQIYGSAVGDKGAIVYDTYITIHKYRDEDVKYRKYFMGNEYFAISLFSPYAFSLNPGKDVKAAKSVRLKNSLEELRAAERKIVDKLSEKAQAIKHAHHLDDSLKRATDDISILVTRLDCKRNIPVLDPFRSVLPVDEHTETLRQCLQDKECRELAERGLRHY